MSNLVFLGSQLWGQYRFGLNDRIPDDVGGGVSIQYYLVPVTGCLLLLCVRVVGVGPLRTGMRHGAHYCSSAGELHCLPFCLGGLRGGTTKNQ